MLMQDHSISGPWSFLVKEEVQCLCEGGRNCSHENPARQKVPNAIAGLNSSWVGDQVLAMARPWQENVLKHDVVSQFKQQNIGMILNLQEVGDKALSGADVAACCTVPCVVAKCAGSMLVQCAVRAVAGAAAGALASERECSSAPDTKFSRHEAECDL